MPVDQVRGEYEGMYDEDGKAQTRAPLRVAHEKDREIGGQAADGEMGDDVGVENALPIDATEVPAGAAVVAGRPSRGRVGRMAIRRLI